MSTREVDMALQLYRDPNLLRTIMVAARVPETTPRVAISLDDPKLGPFIIVTRGGDFVTCLGRGMRVGDWPIVTRGQLDAFTEKTEQLRARMEIANQLAGTRERPFMYLMRRLLDNAEYLSRDEFLALSVWGPLLPGIFFDLYQHVNRELIEQTSMLCGIRRFKGNDAESALRGYWKLAHAAGHLMLLAGTTGQGNQLRSTAEMHSVTRSALGLARTQACMIPFVVREKWVVGRNGKQLLPLYKGMLFEDTTRFELYDTVLGLIAIGRRNSGLRAEIVKTLRSAQAAARNTDATSLHYEMSREVLFASDLARRMIESDDDALEASLQSVGGSLASGKLASLPDEIMRDATRILPLYDYADRLSQQDKLVRAALLVAATARDAPERFYFRQAVLRERPTMWNPRHALALLERSREQYRANREPPARRANAPGRNEPCPCGSSVKFKLCCGTGRRDAPRIV